MFTAHATSVAELLRLRLEEQLHNMDRLRSVSERQRQSLHRRQFDKIGEHEREKQTLLELIRSREQELDSLREAWDNDKHEAPPEARKEIESLLERLRTTVRTIVAIEGDNVTIVRRLREEVDSELRRLMGRRHTARYRGPKFVEGRFFDSTG